MRVTVEVLLDPETQQWCCGMTSAPWIASCGATRAEARKMFLQAFRAYFESAPQPKRKASSARGQIEIIRVA